MKSEREYIHTRKDHNKVKIRYVNVNGNYMAGRPKNPNKPPAVTAVRVSKRTYKKIREHHRGTEPFDVTVERAFDELDELKKKVAALQVQIEEQELELESKGQAYLKLFTVKENFRYRLELLEKQRAQLGIKKSLK